MTSTGIGASVRRKEDHRFITGKGRYTDDINRPGQAYAYFLRSPHAHARIKSIDAQEAKRKPGVVAILTGDDIAADKVGGLICGWMIHSKDGTPMKAGAHPALAQGKVRYVGDHVAVVVAESISEAKDAAEAIRIDYEVLPAQVDTATAQRQGAPLIHDVAPDNTVYRWHLGDKAKTDAAFATAKHVTKIDLTNNRLVPNPMEPRAAIGEYELGRRRVHALHHKPEPACGPSRAFGLHRHRARAQAARGRARRRGWVRLEDLHLCGGDRLRLGGQEGGSSGEMDLRPHRGLPFGCAWARPRHACRARHRRDGQDHRAQGEDDRQPRRLSLDLLIVGPDLSLRAPAFRAVPISRTSIARSTASTPTPRRSMPTAARVVPRRPSSSSASSSPRRASSARILRSSAARTTSNPSRIRHR